MDDMVDHPNKVSNLFYAVKCRHCQVSGQQCTNLAHAQTKQCIHTVSYHSLSTFIIYLHLYICTSVYLFIFVHLFQKAFSHMSISMTFYIGSKCTVFLTFLVYLRLFILSFPPLSNVMSCDVT